MDDQAMVGEAVRRKLATQADIRFHFCADPAKVMETIERVKEDPRTYGAYINDSVYSLLTQSTLPKETEPHQDCSQRGPELVGEQ